MNARWWLCLTGGLVALWLVLVTVALVTAPPLLAVSGTMQGELVALDLRQGVRHTLLVPPFNGQVLVHAWEPNSGRLVAVERAPAGTRMRLREPDGAVRTLGSYGLWAVHWTSDGSRLVVSYSTSFYMVDPATGVAQRLEYRPRLRVDDFFLQAFSSSQLALKAVGGVPNRYYSLDPTTATITPLHNLPCGGTPTEFDVHLASGALVYTCLENAGVQVWGRSIVADVVLPKPEAPGLIARPKWSPDASHVLYRHIPSERQQNVIIIVDHYLVDMQRGTMRQVMIGNQLGGVQWLPPGALPRGR